MPANVENEIRSGDQLSHYEIEKLLGAGGMGEVYLARDTKLDRKVAIKILNQSLEANTSNVSRFIQEAKAASALNHPNILVIHEIGEHEARHFIVSEYIDGQTLRTALNGNERPIREILDISIQIASALNAAHEKNIVHRDIKPENVILRPDGLVKVLDFGLAKLIEQKNRVLVGFEDETARQNQTEKGLIVGTVNYFSPEQAKGDAVDQRTDIFSLGVLMYEMITGKTPFAGESIADNFSNLINKDPQPLSRFAANIPDELQRIVSKMLRKNRDDRYQTMKDLLIDLRDLTAKIASEEKLERTSSPDAEKATAILHAATADANRQTAAPETAASTQSIPFNRSWLVYASVISLLVGAVALVFYLRQPAAASQPEIKSLAVLPLKSLDTGENYLGMGIADAVI
ncbi:MAG: serine/threonine-protein kinase, partial [Acidobacteriota bacterium]